MNHGKKRDANERAIITALRGAGASVAQLDGTGVPDLLVQFRGRMTLLEVKDPTMKHRRSPGELGELTPAQRAWWAAWSEPMPVMVKTVAEALAAIGAT